MKDISETEEEEFLDQDTEADEDFFDSEENDLDDFEIRHPDDIDISSPDAESPAEDYPADDHPADNYPEEAQAEAAEEQDLSFEAEDLEDLPFENAESGYNDYFYEAAVEDDEGPDVFAPKREDSAADTAGKTARGLTGFLGRMDPLKRAALMAAAGAVCALVIFGIIMVVLKQGNSQPSKQASEEPEEQIVLVEQQVSDVSFLSFGPLSVKNEEGYVSVKEFSQILDRLYADGYVLVDIYLIGQTDENGNMVLNRTIEVPEGKKPLVIMQRDVSYPISRQTDSFAGKLVVDAEGCVRNEYTDSNNEVSMGDYDLIPMIETFVREHPDFSYDGARGIIGLTGYNGILGYRTSSYLASEEDNPYGTFDTENQVMAMESVLETLQACGWRFASNGFGDRISYGSEYSLVENDAADWKGQVGSLIGGTDLLLLPRKTDIGSWAPYDENNTKYTLMRSLGFRFYLIAEDETPGFMLAKDEYLRIAVTEINTYSEFEAAFTEGSEEEDTAA